jgi:hypothetical protein
MIGQIAQRPLTHINSKQLEQHMTWEGFNHPEELMAPDMQASSRLKKWG